MDNSVTCVKFSIIIPVYNVETYIRECLDSIVRQTFKDFEVICIDDESTDASLSILQEYAQKDARFKIHTQKNQGQGIARNNALDMAQGKYIVFIDPDDWVEDYFLKILDTEFEKENADVIQFDYKQINEYSGKEKIFSLKNKYKKLFCDKNFYCWKEIKEDTLNNPRQMVWDMAYSLDFIKRNNIKFAPNKHAEDHIFSISVTFKADKIFYMDKVLYNYRLRANSSVNRTTVDHFCIFDNIRTLEAFLTENRLLPDLEKELNGYKNEVMYRHYANIPENSRVEYMQKCAQLLPADELKKLKHRIKYKNRSFWELIFSIKNKTNNAVKYKIVTILGFEFLIKPRKAKL